MKNIIFLAVFKCKCMSINVWLLLLLFLWCNMDYCMQFLEVLTPCYHSMCASLCHTVLCIASLCYSESTKAQKFNIFSSMSTWRIYFITPGVTDYVFKVILLTGLHCWMAKCKWRPSVISTYSVYSLSLPFDVGW